jgi:hypothetical protein
VEGRDGQDEARAGNKRRLPSLTNHQARDGRPHPVSRLPLRVFAGRKRKRRGRDRCGDGADAHTTGHVQLVALGFTRTHNRLLWVKTSAER